MNYKHLYQSIYGASVFFLVVAPGSALVAIKALLMLLLFSATGVRLVSSGVAKGSLLHLLLWASFILVWLLIGIVNNNEVDALREAAAYFSFLLFVFCFIVGLQWVSRNVLIKVLVAGALCYGALKFGILLAVILGFINPVDLYWWLQDVASGIVMSGFWSGGIPRITMANDYVLPLILLMMLIEYAKQEISGWFFWISLTIIFMLIAITLSRYLYLFSALILCVFLILNFLKHRVFKIGVFVLLAGLIVVPVMLVEMGYAERLSSRFEGEDAASSDITKADQVSPLIDMIDSSKVIGHGFGLSMVKAGRGNKTSFQAELQWFSLTAKVGFVGLGIIFSALALYSANLLFYVLDFRIKILLATAWLLWLLAGFFNPVMLLATTSVNYLIFYAASLTGKPKI